MKERMEGGREEKKGRRKSSRSQFGEIFLAR